MDIVAALARREGYTTYLEIATPTTGNEYASIDHEHFRVAERLLYRVPPGFDDGAPIDYRTASEDCAPLLERLAAEGRRYDVILVDPFHTYDCSRRDLELAMRLLAERGTLVVHDCNPPDRALVRPSFRPGRWCGVTYAAFLDFVASREDVAYCTLDTDYGCGIVRRRSAATDAGALGPISRRRQRGWRIASRSRLTRWPYFARHRRELLRLASPGAFDWARSAPVHRTPERS